MLTPSLRGSVTHPGGRDLVPTSRALELMPELDDILRRITQLSNPAVFDPCSNERAFRIACTDYEITTLLVPLVQQLRESAPGVRLHLLNGGDLGAQSFMKYGGRMLKPNFAPCTRFVATPN